MQRGDIYKRDIAVQGVAGVGPGNVFAPLLVKDMYS